MARRKAEDRPDGRPAGGRPQAKGGGHGQLARGDEPPTARDESAEPSGEERAANEAEREEATQRPEAVEEAGSVDAASAAAGDGAAPTERPEEAEQDPLDELRSERDRYLELAQRTQADFENYRKRAAKEAAAAGSRAKAGLVRELLPVLDNLERALATAAGGNGDAGNMVA